MNNDVSRIIDSQAFKDNSPSAYLCNIFFDGQQSTVGFFNKEDSLIYTYNAEPIAFINASKAVAEDSVPILEIDDEVKNHIEAFDKGRQYAHEHYQSKQPVKSFVLLQSFKQTLVWQFVALTASMESISVRFDARTLAVVDESIETFAKMM